MYWHYRFEDMNKKEILADRLRWLWGRMLVSLRSLLCKRTNTI
jgi:hypothetical protein